MKISSLEVDTHHRCSGRISLLLLWLLGVPIPVLGLIFLLRGCSS